MDMEDGNVAWFSPVLENELEVLVISVETDEVVELELL
jgi:hypothetical protein